MRDFFQHQDAARRRSQRLAAILAAAILSTIVATATVLAALTMVLALLHVTVMTNIRMSPAYWYGRFAGLFCVLATLVAVIVISVAVYRTLQALESGGIEVARQLGGTRVLTFGRDPEYQRLINVVEELSIAASTTVPKIFVLDGEMGINAFAAGIGPRDTVVGVTRGALEHLNRSQLQGVLAHEFSHIVNGDVRINVQALGALQGIEAIASAARYLLRIGVSSSGGGSMLATAFGCVLWPVGQIGVLFGSLARMALNRQREFLADAAAVQYTRDPQGLASALKLIAAHAVQGRMASSAAQSASHSFFAEGIPALGRLLASHPPIESRIQRIDPAWDGTLPASLPAQCAPGIVRMESDPRCDDVECDELRAAVSNTGAAMTAESQIIAPWSPDFAQDCSDVSGMGAGGLAEVGAVALADEKVAQAVGTIASPSCETPAMERGPSRLGDISEADKLAYLESIARANADPNRRSYDPQVTHWPTLAAAAAALFVAWMLFSWITSR